MVRMSSPVVAVTPFGAALRRWRLALGASQLALANLAATTTRHVSFLETGRSRPSGEMVARLAEALELPLREANDLFRAAGLAAAFPETPLGADDLAPFNAVVEQMLSRHDPYPAYAIDRHLGHRPDQPRCLDVLARGRRARRGAVDLRRAVAGADRELVGHRVGRSAPTSVGGGAATRRRGVGNACVPGHRSVPWCAGAADHGRRTSAVPHFRVGEQLIRTITVVAQFGADRTRRVCAVRAKRPAKCVGGLTSDASPLDARASRPSLRCAVAAAPILVARSFRAGEVWMNDGPGGVAPGRAHGSMPVTDTRRAIRPTNGSRRVGVRTHAILGELAPRRGCHA